MTPELLWTYMLNIIINSVLSFYTITLVVLLLILLLRIKNRRAIALLLCAPTVKLLLDPFLYQFSSWALLHQLNPITAEEGSRMISVMVGYVTSFADLVLPTTGIQLMLHSGETFSLADLAALSIGPAIVQAIVVCTCIISIGLFGKMLYQYHRSIGRISNLKRKAVPCMRPLHNLYLAQKIVQSHIRILLTDATTIPCACGFWNKCIVFPTALVEELTQVEFEAIIAHELNHLQWQDGMCRVVWQFASALFWWVPKKWLLDRVEFAQEQACDVAVNAFQISRLDLASALVKSAKQVHNSLTDCLSVTCFVGRQTLSVRFRALLTEPALPNKTLRWLQIGLAGVASIMFLFGKFWIF